MSLLKLGGLSSVVVALLHVAIVLIGAPAFRYFGAGEDAARAAEQGSVATLLGTLGLAAMFGIWAVYGFAESERLKKLPLPRIGVCVIGAVYTLRGLLLGPQIFWFLSGSRGEGTLRHMGFSLVSLLTGLLYLVGARRAWRRLGRKDEMEMARQKGKESRGC